MRDTDSRWLWGRRRSERSAIPEKCWTGVPMTRWRLHRWGGKEERKQEVKKRKHEGDEWRRGDTKSETSLASAPSAPSDPRSQVLETPLIPGAGLVASTTHRKWSITKTEVPIAFLYLMCVRGLSLIFLFGVVTANCNLTLERWLDEQTDWSIDRLIEKQLSPSHSWRPEDSEFCCFLCSKLIWN